MKLQDFISETLKDIFAGIKVAQNHVAKIEGAINPTGLKYLSGSSGVVQHIETSRIGQEIEFDLEICESKEKSGEGKAGIEIHVLSFGAKAKTATKDRSANRLKFKIPVIFPKGKYEEKETGSTE